MLEIHRDGWAVLETCMEGCTVLETHREAWAVL